MSTEKDGTKKKVTPKAVKRGPVKPKVAKPKTLRVAYSRKLSWGRYATNVIEIEASLPFINSVPRAILEKIIREDSAINRADLDRPSKARVQVISVQDVTTAVVKNYRASVWDSAQLNDWADKGVYTEYLDAERKGVTANTSNGSATK